MVHRAVALACVHCCRQCRSYRNGFVWHDLADDDYIHPVVGREYVLKGTERLHPPARSAPPLLDAAAASSSSSGSQETPTSTSSARWEARGGPAHRKKSASSCGAADQLGEYVVYKGEERAADAATQTEDDVGRGRGHPRRAKAPAAQDELSRADTSSPPTASTSPETLEALIKADGRVLAAVSGSGRCGGSLGRASGLGCDDGSATYYTSRRRLRWYTTSLP